MRCLLDTGMAQEFISRNAKVVERADVARRAGNRIGICTPVLGELWSGVEGSTARERNVHRLRAALSRLVVWPNSNEAAARLGVRRVGNLAGCPAV
jgi:predicted nucleic acid-binding protein